MAEGPDLDDPDASASGGGFGLPKGSSDKTPPMVTKISIGPSVDNYPSAITLDKITGLLTSDTLTKLGVKDSFTIGTAAAPPRPSFNGFVNEPLKRNIEVTFNSTSNKTRTLSSPVKSDGSFSIPISLDDIQFMGREQLTATFYAIDLAGNIGRENFAFYAGAFRDGGLIINQGL